MTVKCKKSLLLVMLCTVPVGLQAALSYFARGSAAKAAGYAQDFAVLNSLRSTHRWGMKLEESMRGPVQVKPDVVQAEELFTPKNIKKFVTEYQVSQPFTASSSSSASSSASSFAVQPGFALMKLSSAAQEKALQQIAVMGKDIVTVQSAFVSLPCMNNVISSLPQKPLLLEASTSSVPVNPFHLKKEGPQNLIYIKFQDGRGLWKIGKKVVSDLYAQKMLTPELYSKKKGKPLSLALPEAPSQPVVLSLSQLNNFIYFATFKQLTQLQEVDLGVEILPPYEGDNAVRLLNDIVTTEIFLPEEIVFYSGNIMASLNDSVDVARALSLNDFYAEMIAAADFGPMKLSNFALFFKNNSELISKYAIACIDTLQKTKDISLEQIFEKQLTDDFSDVTYPSLDQIPFVFQPKVGPVFLKACRLMVKKYVTGLLQTITANIVNQIVGDVPATYSSGEQFGADTVQVTSGQQFYDIFKNTALFLLLLDYFDEHEEDDTDEKTVKVRQELFNDNKIMALFWLMMQHRDVVQPLKDVFKQFYDDTDQFIEKILSEVKGMKQASVAKLKYIQALIKKNKKMPNISPLTPPLHFPNVYSFNIKDVDFDNTLSVILSQISMNNRNLLSPEMGNALFTSPLMSSRKDPYKGFADTNSIEQLYLVVSLQRRHYLQQQAAEQAEREAQEKIVAERQAAAQAEREAQEKREAQAEREAQEKIVAERQAVAQAEREAQEKREAQAEREAQEKIISAKRQQLADKMKSSEQQILRDEEAEFAAIMKQFNDELLTKQEALKKIQHVEAQAMKSASPKAAVQGALQDSANQVAVEVVTPGLSRKQREDAAAALTDLHLSASSLLQMPPQQAANLIGQATKKQSVDIGSNAAKAAGVIATALVEQSSKLPEVITANASNIVHTVYTPTADLSMPLQIAKEFISNNIVTVTFDQLSSMLAKMSFKVQATPGLLGSVQVCIWNLKKWPDVSKQVKVEQIIGIVAVAAKIR